MKDEDLLRLLDAAAEPDPGRILDALIQATGSERGYLVLRDGIPVTRRMDGEEIKVSRTLLSRALAEGRPLIASAADLATIESVRKQKVRSVLVLPLKRSNCAVYLDNGTFEPVESLTRYAAALDKALAHRPYGELIGRSKAMVDLHRDLDRIAAAPYPVLIVGESGTGKELIARALHRSGPYVATNCAVFPEHLVASELFGHVKGAFTGADRDRAGLFEQAHGGILFLDEVAELTPRMQAKLLRLLQTRTYEPVGGDKSFPADFQLVAATNRGLQSMVQAGTFRSDLYYRLNVLRVVIPPLRERKEDIPALAAHFLREIPPKIRMAEPPLTPDALSALTSHDWPGNVRELEHALTRLILQAQGRRIDHATVQSVLGVDRPLTAARTLADIERSAILASLEHTKWNYGDTCAILGISRPTLRRKIALYGIAGSSPE